MTTQHPASYPRAAGIAAVAALVAAAGQQEDGAFEVPADAVTFPEDPAPTGGLDTWEF